MIATITSLKPAIPPRRPETSFKVHAINRSAPVAACCAACIARLSACCTLPLFEVPLNVFYGGIVVLCSRRNSVGIIVLSVAGRYSTRNVSSPHRGDCRWLAKIVDHPMVHASVHALGA